MNAETMTFRSKEDPEFINKHGVDVFIEQQRSERRNQAILDRRKAEHKRRDPEGFCEMGTSRSRGASPDHSADGPRGARRL
jgi:hypothetical protein